jgi:hypothetical protein
MLIALGLVGAMLIMRGVGILLPALDGLLATSLALLLAAAGIAYQGGLLKGLEPQPR